MGHACVGEGFPVPSRVLGTGVCAVTCAHVLAEPPRVLGSRRHSPFAAPAEADESSHFVIGAVLFRTLGLILPAPR